MKIIQTDSDDKVKALAACFNVGQNSMGNYLNGKRTVPYDVLVKFAQYYQVTTDYLVGLTDDPKPPFPVSGEERDMLMRLRALTPEQKELILQGIDLMTKQNQRQ